MRTRQIGMSFVSAHHLLWPPCNMNTNKQYFLWHVGFAQSLAPRVLRPLIDFHKQTQSISKQMMLAESLATVRWRNLFNVGFHQNRICTHFVCVHVGQKITITIIIHRNSIELASIKPSTQNCNKNVGFYGSMAAQIERFRSLISQK